MSPILQAGTPAPEIKFRVGRDELDISSYRGEKNVVVAFYVAAFTGG